MKRVELGLEPEEMSDSKYLKQPEVYLFSW